jgi:hypothetical protein
MQGPAADARCWWCSRHDIWYEPCSDIDWGVPVSQRTLLCSVTFAAHILASYQWIASAAENTPKRNGHIWFFQGDPRIYPFYVRAEFMLFDDWIVTGDQAPRSCTYQGREGDCDISICGSAVALRPGKSANAGRISIATNIRAITLSPREDGSYDKAEGAKGETLWTRGDVHVRAEGDAVPSFDVVVGTPPQVTVEAPPVESNGAVAVYRDRTLVVRWTLDGPADRNAELAVRFSDEKDDGSARIAVECRKTASAKWLAVPPRALAVLPSHTSPKGQIDIAITRKKTIDSGDWRISIDGRVRAVRKLDGESVPYVVPVTVQ